jgi:hypothetical protein
MSLRAAAASFLRRAAWRLDGREYTPLRWHKLNVQAMNRYIERTEAYMADLEQLVQHDTVCELIDKHKMPRRRPT